MSTFLERLLKAIADDNPHSFAQKCGFRDSLIRKYIKEGSIPRMDNLVTIARTAGVNIEWLATGQGDMRPGDDKKGKTDKPDAPASINDQRIIPYGRRKTDLPMSSQLRRAMEGLLYLETEDSDSFIVLMGEIIKNEKKARENEDLKKTGNSDA